MNFLQSLLSTVIIVVVILAGLVVATSGDSVNCTEWRQMNQDLFVLFVITHSRCEKWQDGKTRSDLNLDAD